VNAHAYAQGTDIHVASGQERHLPHEAWHVVQQAQGRVKPTLQMKGVAINDDLGLEREADMMGARAVDHAAQRLPGGSISAQRMSLGHGSTAAKLGPTTMQRVVYKTMAEMWADVAPDQDEKEIKTITASNSALAQVYGDVTANLDKMDFIQDGRQPEAEIAPQKSGLYRIHYGPRAELKKPYDDKTRYVGAILHEMMHITAGLQYATNVPGNLPGAPVGHVANMNLPAATGEVKKKDAEFGLTPNQFEDEKLGAEAQIAIIFANWHTLEKEADLDLENHALTKPQCGVVKERIDYAMKVSPLGHYDTVLTDILYYLQAEGAAQSRSYDYAHRMLMEANIRRTQKAGAVQEILRAPLPPPPEVLDVKQTEKKPPPIPPAPKQSFWGFLTCCFPQQVKNKT